MTDIIGNLEDQVPPDKTQQPANFEMAISATGYGPFHYLLIVIAIPCCFSPVFSTTSMSFILPSAECDLQLSLMDKGTLNAVTYAGMISSAVMWGYLSDTLGRKKLMVCGYFLDVIVALLCALSQFAWLLIVLKFLSGFITCGPFVVLMSYLTEFHGAKHRPRIIMTSGILYASASITLPLLAWAIIPQSWHLNIGPLINLRSWQIFLALSCLPSLTSGILISFMPESPKFLMSQGQNDEALKIFQTIFKFNTGKDASDYPVKVLVDEQKETVQYQMKLLENREESLDQWKGLRNALLQITPLFKGSLLRKSILVFTIQFCILLGVNTLRLWLPVMFTILSEENSDIINSTESSNLCSLIMASVNKSAANMDSHTNDNGVCVDLIVSDEVYINTIYVGLVGVFVYAVSISITNIFGAKFILIFALIIAGSFGLLLYWATNSFITFTFSSLYVSIGTMASSALISIVVNIFPTTLRTMAVSLVMMFGRTGSIIGNMLFPYLLSFGCFPPFALLGFILIACSSLCTLLPRNINNPLQ